MKKLQVILLLAVGAILFGCICGGTGGGFETPTPGPAHTATPSGTHTPIGTITPGQTTTPAGTSTPVGGLTTPTPSGGTQSWEELFGCARTGLSYTYRVRTGETTMDMSYETSNGGMVNGIDTVLKTITVETQGTAITTKEWDSKVGCRCVKVEMVYGGQAIPGQCPPQGSGGGEPENAQTTITSMGIETISVPAYTGPAMKYSVTSVGSSGTVTVEVWQAPNIKVPVKWSSSGTTFELVRYSG